MKKFFIQSLLFSLPIVLISYNADVFISKKLKKNHAYAGDEYAIWNDIIDGKVNSEIVIYGHSKAWLQIDPKAISDSLNKTTYNLGVDGQNFEVQYLRHSLLLKYNIQPRLIILSLDVFTLSELEDLYNPDQFLPYMLFNNEIKKATINYDQYNFIDYELPLIRYYGKKGAIKHAMKLFVNQTGDPAIRIKGYKARDEEWNSDFDKMKKKMNFFYTNLDMTLVSLFENFLIECKTKKIKIIFVYAPEYIEGQKFIKNREEVVSIYNMFSKKYDIPFYNFSDDTMAFDKKYFYNALHLNKTGAELFTNKLIEKLKANPSFKLVADTH